MDFWRKTLAITITGASAIAGASAQAPSDDLFSGLIRTVGGQASTPAAHLPDSISMISSVLGGFSGEETDDDFSYISGVLSAAGTPAVAPSMGGASVTERVLASLGSEPVETGALSAVSSLGVLNFLSNAYGERGYHQSGYWGPDGSTYQSATYRGPMPVSGNEDFYRPAWGPITSGYGFRAKYNRIHKGVDIALSVGDTVRAALPGVVAGVKYEPGGYGNYVVIAHSNGVETRYAHLSEAIVFAGQQVEAGDAIALGGNTGNSTGPHLHFETRYMGTAVDPTTVFDFTGRSMNRYMAAANLDNGFTKQMRTGLNATKGTLKDKKRYVVREGDTPAKIAKRAGISTLKLCQLNFITETDKLQPGTMLRLK